MKSRILLAFTILSACILLFTSNSSGPGLVQGIDLTGSPLSSGSCNSCHGGGNFSPKVTATLLDVDKEVLTYKAGQTYTLKITVTVGTGSPAGYGFQTVALAGATNLTAGSFGTLPSGTHLVTINSRNYVEHSRTNTTNTWNIAWIAPVAGSGSVRVYAAGNAVNGNRSSNGDQSGIMSAPLVIAENPTSGIKSPEALNAEVSAFPNPVTEELQVKISSQELLKVITISVIDLNGRVISQQKKFNPGTEFQASFEASEWAKGVYLLRLSDGERVTTKKIIKL
jgi:hypothetical protein